MAEIDQVIDQHGGWPGAFVTTGSGSESAASRSTTKTPSPDLGLQTEDELPLG